MPIPTSTLKQSSNQDGSMTNEIGMIILKYAKIYSAQEVRKNFIVKEKTIERFFGTAKEHHGFRYTQMVGNAKMEMKGGLTFACLNLKKISKNIAKSGLL